MPLTDTAAKNAKPREKVYRLVDQKGMYLEVHPNGSKYWRLKYRFAGKEKRLALGVYPDVSLKAARDKRDTARKLLSADTPVDPAAVRKAQKAGVHERAANSFEVVAREWFEKNARNWVTGHAGKIISRLERDVFPWLGSRPIAEITPSELLGVLQRIENRGALDTAHRAHQNCGQIFRYAIATQRADRNPASDLKGALPPARETHYASIKDPVAIGELLRAIDGYEGHNVTKCALRLAPLVFVRPGELRRAEWAEVDLDGTEWRIPAEKMKARQPHIVPLSTQAVHILLELQPLTQSSRYLFPSVRTNKRPMSENTINAALRRLGYPKEQMTGHGFRSMASTLLNEQGWRHDAIERQLAHAERNEVRAAYNYAEYLPERKEMMQKWANYLDKLKAGAEIIPIDQRAR